MKTNVAFLLLFIFVVVVICAILFVPKKQTNVTQQNVPDQQTVSDSIFGKTTNLNNIIKTSFSSSSLEGNSHPFNSNKYINDKNILFPLEYTVNIPYKAESKKISFFLGTLYDETYPIIYTRDNGDSWNSINNKLLSIASNDVAIIKDKYFFLGAGNTNSIMFTTDFKVWKGFATSIMTIAESIAFNGKNIVIVGQGINSILCSDDFGVTFNELGTNLFIEGKKVIWSGDRFIALGNTKKNDVRTKQIAWSYNGMIWNVLDLANSFLFQDTIFLFSSCNNIAYNGNIFVIGGSGENNLGYSVDGYNWIVSPSSPKKLIGNVINDILWTGLFFLAVGGYYNDINKDEMKTTIIKSYDGITWEDAIVKEDQPLFDWMATSVAFHGNYLFVHGISKMKAYKTFLSGDGKKWHFYNNYLLENTMTSKYI